MNLDPATQRVPFNAHIDIRDTVDYKSVMKKYVKGCPTIVENIAGTKMGQNCVVCGITFYNPAVFVKSSQTHMFRYNLGPNGAIMTSLNLFATRFGTVLQLLEKSSHACK